MKPRVTLADLQAYERLKVLPLGTKLKARDAVFTLDFVWGLHDPHMPRLELKYRENKKLHTYNCRIGDPLMLELSPL